MAHTEGINLPVYHLIHIAPEPQMMEPLTTLLHIKMAKIAGNLYAPDEVSNLHETTTCPQVRIFIQILMRNNLNA